MKNAPGGPGPRGVAAALRKHVASNPFLDGTVQWGIVSAVHGSTSTTLSASASVGATTIYTVAAPLVNDLLQIGPVPTFTPRVTAVTTSGSDYAVTIQPGLVQAQASGAAVTALNTIDVYLNGAQNPSPASSLTWGIRYYSGSSPSVGDVLPLFRGLGGTASDRFALGQLASAASSSPSSVSLTETTVTSVGTGTVSLATGDIDVPYLTSYNNPTVGDTVVLANVTGSGGGTLSVPQSPSYGSAASGSPANVLGSNATVGNAVILNIWDTSGPSGTISSVTSPMGTFTPLTPTESSLYGQQVFICESVATASKQITVSTSDSGGWFAIAVEVAGGATTPTVTAISGTSTHPTGTLTVPTDGTGMVFIYPNGTLTGYASSPWTDPALTTGPDVAYTTAAGSQTAQWTTSTSGAWQGLMLTLQPNTGTTSKVVLGAVGPCPFTIISGTGLPGALSEPAGTIYIDKQYGTLFLATQEGQWVMLGGYEPNSNTVGWAYPGVSFNGSTSGSAYNEIVINAGTDATGSLPVLLVYADNTNSTPSSSNSTVVMGTANTFAVVAPLEANIQYYDSTDGITDAFVQNGVFGVEIQNSEAFYINTSQILEWLPRSTVNVATVTGPTSFTMGVAFTPSTVGDCEIALLVTAGGTLTMKLGASNIFSGTVATGVVITKYVPCSFTVTFSGTATLSNYTCTII